jgi:hypothetical protein
VIAHDPLHGSGRAELPHPALASGDDAEAAHSFPPRVPAPAHCARRSGSRSGTRFAAAGSPWPVPFPPPPPPPPYGRLCSETSAVLRNCPTSHVRSSSAYVLDFPDTACHLPQAVPWDLPVLEQDVSPCMHRVYDLARPNASRASDASAIAFRLIPRRRLLEERLFRGSIPGLHGPLSTLRLLLTQGYRMTRGRRGSLLLHRVAFSFHYTLPV